MKYLKTFEKINRPEIGEWTIVNLEPEEYTSPDGKMFFDYVTTTPGLVGDSSDIKMIYLEYDNIPIEIKNWFFYNSRAFPPYEIGYHSKNKEDVEAYINQQKFNI